MSAVTNKPHHEKSSARADYQSLINVGELMIVVWVIGIISRIRVKPKEIDTIIKVEKRIKE